MKYPRVIARVGESPPQYPVWDDAILEEEDEAPGSGPSRVLGWLPVSGDVEEGTTSLEDDGLVEWRHEVLSPEEGFLVADRALSQTYRVTTTRDMPDGMMVASTYLVPGAWLNACIRELAHGEDETVLGIEVVEPRDPGSNGREGTA